jgi:hypothetical protein
VPATAALFSYACTVFSIFFSFIFEGGGGVWTPPGSYFAMSSPKSAKEVLVGVAVKLLESNRQKSMNQFDFHKIDQVSEVSVSIC